MVAGFGADTDPTGRLHMPTLTVHAIDDPVAFVELENAFADSAAPAGSSARLVQTFNDEHEHSGLADAEHAALMQALLQWAAGGARPTPETVAARCAVVELRFGAACRFVPGHRAAPPDSHVAPRERRKHSACVRQLACAAPAMCPTAPAGRGAGSRPR